MAKQAAVSSDGFLDKLQQAIGDQQQEQIEALVREHMDTCQLVQKQLMATPKDSPHVDQLRHLGTLLWEVHSSILAENSDELGDLNADMKVNMMTEKVKG